MFLVRLLSPFGTLSVVDAQELTPREGSSQAADQLNSSLGCLLCGVGRTSVAQSLPLSNQTSKT